jgi:processing peptidase subunit beta
MSALASAARSRRRLIPYLHRLLHSGPASAAAPSTSPFLRHASPVPRTPDHSPYLRFPDVRVSTLPSGLRVVTQAFPAATRMASVGVWVDAGSRFELPGTNGTAHFLEHMAFKGTGRRPNAQALEVEIEDMGARLNAYTSREQTTFFADVQARHVPDALDVLSDILQHPRLPEKALQRERGVILREMEEVSLFHPFSVLCLVSFLPYTSIPPFTKRGQALVMLNCLSIFSLQLLIGHLTIVVIVRVKVKT